MIFFDTHIILIAPILTLLLGAILCLLFWTNLQVQKIIGLITTLLFLGFATYEFYVVHTQGLITLQAGGWKAPYGITLVVDRLSAIMVLITAIIGSCSYLYAMHEIGQTHQKRGFFPLFLFLLMGVTGAFITGDVFNLYVWYEVMLVASFVMIAIGNKKVQLEGAVKYVILNFIASGFFLVGIGILYKSAGTMNMAQLADIFRNTDTNPLAGLSAIFLLLGFGIKSAMFPLFFWLPASYHTPPVAISGLMAGLLTKVGVYSLIRFFTLIYIQDVEFTHHILLVGAGLTMVAGIFGAIIQSEIRKILSFHIVSQIGYMVMGLALFSPLGLAASVFYIVHHIIVKANLFLISGLIHRVSGHFELKNIHSLYKNYPLIAVVFVIAAFSLGGIPPLSGFWGKFMLAKAGLEAGEYVIVAVSLAVGILTLYSMTKIWNKAFWEEKDVPDPEVPHSTINATNYLMVIPCIFLAAITVSIGLYPDFLLDVSMQIADELLNPEVYIKAVLAK